MRCAVCLPVRLAVTNQEITCLSQTDGFPQNNTLDDLAHLYMREKRCRGVVVTIRQLLYTSLLPKNPKFFGKAPRSIENTLHTLHSLHYLQRNIQSLPISYLSILKKDKKKGVECV